MTKEEATAAGRAHAEEGRQLTPYECREFDQQLFALMRGMELSQQAKFYNEMKGAYNKGWQQKYFEMTGDPEEPARGVDFEIGDKGEYPVEEEQAGRPGEPERGDMKQYFNAGRETLSVVHNAYSNGRLAIQLADKAGIPFTMLTVNVPEANLLPGEFVVRPEGQEFVTDAALASGIFLDTGKRVPVGREEGHVWMYASRESYPEGAASAA